MAAMEIKGPVLRLVLTYRWYDMIEARIKKEEYRAQSPAWNRIFGTGKIKIKGKYYNPTDVIIEFSRGYTKNRKQMYIKCEGLLVKKGNPNWGAQPGVEYYTLLL